MDQLRSRVVYQNQWMSVREDQVRLADGSESIYGVIDKPDYALVLPRESGGFWMVEQFRYPVARRAWEFPMGSWSTGASGTALELAQAELAEETGIKAGHWRHLGRLAQAYGFASQGFDVFLATGLSAGPPQREASEADMIHAFFTDAELARMIRAGDVIDSASLAALTLLALSGQ